MGIAGDGWDVSSGGPVQALSTSPFVVSECLAGKHWLQVQGSARTATRPPAPAHSRRLRWSCRGAGVGPESWARRCIKCIPSLDSHRGFQGDGCPTRHPRPLTSSAPCPGPGELILLLKGS